VQLHTHIISARVLVQISARIVRLQRLQDQLAVEPEREVRVGASAPSFSIISPFRGNDG
jgi:hypothetical protein